MQRNVQHRNTLKTADVQGFKGLNGVLLFIPKIRTTPIPLSNSLNLLNFFKKWLFSARKEGHYIQCKASNPVETGMTDTLKQIIARL